jgi:hypothetical protein
MLFVASVDICSRTWLRPLDCRRRCSCYRNSFSPGRSPGINLARAMYRSGYDFRHFLAGGLCVGLAEVIVRLAWIARELGEGNTLAGAMPVASKPRLRSGLLLAHGVGAAVNAGKIAITQNPLALNWAQWLALFRYLLPQMHWLLVEKQGQREAFVQRQLDMSWAEFSTELSETWRMTFSDEPVAVL